MSASSAERTRAFDTELAKLLERYPADRKTAAMLPALRLCQDADGYISPEAMVLVADRLGVAPTLVREVVSFYVMLHEKKPGKHVLDLCTNVSCSLRGSERLLAHIEKKLGISAGQTTPDGRFTLREAECLGSCGTAPAMLVDERFHEALTEAKIDDLLAGMT